MLLAAPLGEHPRAVAERLARASSEASSATRRASTGSRSPAPASSTSSSPTRWYRRALAGAGRRRRRPRAGARPRRPERILVEFVSANPTGPLHVGGGRHAAYGDALARLLDAIGPPGRARVLRQRRRRADRPLRRLDRRPDERRGAARGRLRGRLRAELASAIGGEGIAPDDLEAVGAARRRADARARSGPPWRASASSFDTWFSERGLLDRGEVEAASPNSTRGGHTYQQRGRALAAHHRPSATTRTGS